MRQSGSYWLEDSCHARVPAQRNAKSKHGSPSFRNAVRRCASILVLEIAQCGFQSLQELTVHLILGLEHVCLFVRLPLDPTKTKPAELIGIADLWMISPTNVLVDEKVHCWIAVVSTLILWLQKVMNKAKMSCLCSNNL